MKLTDESAARKSDGIVNGAGEGAGKTGNALKPLQTGNVQWYAVALFVGVIALAVVAKHVVAGAEGPLVVADRWLLGLSLVLILGGFLFVHFRYNRGFASERAWALVGLLALVAVGSGLPGGGMLAVVAVVLAGTHAVTLARFGRCRLHVSHDGTGALRSQE